MEPLPPESVFSYGCWLTSEGPEKGHLVKISEERFTVAMTEAMDIAHNDVGRALGIIKAQVMAQLRKTLAARA